jgi:hypothetical protein
MIKYKYPNNVLSSTNIPIIFNYEVQILNITCIQYGY